MFIFTSQKSMLKMFKCVRRNNNNNKNDKILPNLVEVVVVVLVVVVVVVCVCFKLDATSMVNSLTIVQSPPAPPNPHAAYMPRTTSNPK